MDIERNVLDDLDESALAETLDAGEIAGAGIDVLTEGPRPRTTPSSVAMA